MSILWDSPTLRHVTGGQIKKNVEITGICINSLEITKGDLFIALRGGKRDGHEFIRNALEAGAAAIMADNQEFLKANNLLEKENILLVADCFRALENLAHYARKRFTGKVIAVTGSVGKTTTKDMLQKALSAYGTTIASKKSLNNHLGVPLTLITIPENADFAIMEIGMNHSGEILPLAKMIKPHIGVITAINKAHAGNMGGEIEIAEEKADLFKTLPENGTAIYAEMPEKIEKILKKSIAPTVKIATVGKNTQNTLSLGTAHLLPESSTCRLKYGNQSFNLTLSAPGQHLLEDAALAIAVILSLELEVSKGLKALHLFKPGYGRGEKHLLKRNITLIDETHNASPASVKAACELLALQSSQRKIVILGDMLELGDFSEKEHLSLAPFLIKEQIILFCCGQEMKKLFDKMPENLQGGYEKSSDLLVEPLKKYIKENDYLVAKGSRSMRMDKIVSALQKHFALETQAGENKHAL